MILWWIYIEFGCCLVILAFQVATLTGKCCAREVEEPTRDMIVVSTIVSSLLTDIRGIKRQRQNE
jgi:hypothetical protein